MVGTHLVDDHSHSIHILWAGSNKIMDGKEYVAVGVSYRVQSSGAVAIDQYVTLLTPLNLINKNEALRTGLKVPLHTLPLLCKKANPLAAPDSCLWVQVSIMGIEFA